MKTLSTLTKPSITVLLSFVLITLTGCGAMPDIVPQLPFPTASNSSVTVAQNIDRANTLLNAGKKREAAAAYFQASQQLNSPQRERLILQAAELTSLLNDTSLTQTYLSPINFDRLNLEHQSRFRLIQAQLALNDRNYRETLRILPQRVLGLSDELGQKILSTRMQAAQASADKVALVQELVLQEPTLKQTHLVSLNHDRIWNHAQQIPPFQLEQAKNNINHPILKNWLGLAQLSRIAKFAPFSKKQHLRSQLSSWLQNNPNHPGTKNAISLLNTTPTTTVTPYGVEAAKPILKTPVVKRAPVKNIPVFKQKPTVPVQKAPVKEKIIKPDPNIRSLYEKAKEQIKNL